MLLQVHDELVFEAPDEEIEATLPVVTRSHDRRAGAGDPAARPAAGRCARRPELGRGALRGRAELRSLGLPRLPDPPAA